MRVTVIVPKFGTYKDGDVIEMHESTAKAIAKKGIVALPDGEETEVTPPKKKGKQK